MNGHPQTEAVPFSLDWDADQGSLHEQLTPVVADLARGALGAWPSELAGRPTPEPIAASRVLRSRAYRYLPAEASKGLPDWTRALTPVKVDDPAPRGAESSPRRAAVAEGLPPRLTAELAESVSEVLGLKPSPGVVVSLTTLSRRRHRLELRSEVVTVGSGDTCGLRIPDPQVPEQVAEIRIADAGPWLILTDDSLPVVVDGRQISLRNGCRLQVGCRVSLAGYELTLEDWRPTPRGPGAKLGFRSFETLTADSDPFDSCGGEDLWAEVTLDGNNFWVRLPETWTVLAYRALGEKAPPLGALDQTLDLALTRAMVRAIARRLGERLRRSVLVRSVKPATQISARCGDRGWCRWQGTIQVRSYDLPATAVYAAPERPRPSLGRGRLPFSVRVLGGSVALPSSTLAALEPGDVLIPDQWWNRDGGNADAGADTVLLNAQHLFRRARLVDNPGRPALHIGDPGWTAFPKGDLPTMNATSPFSDPAPDAPTTPTEEPLEASSALPTESLAQELQVAVSFELARLQVSLEELESWEPGATVALDRQPTDAVRILLHHAGGQRPVGHGRVVLVDDQLGIRLDEWYPRGAS